MTIKDYKCKCGHDDFFFADKGNQRGIYCAYCGKWYKWADKDEQNLTLKQESILDKIRAEIEEQVLESLSDGGDDWFTAEKVNECLEIIDKYTAENKE